MLTRFRIEVEEETVEECVESLAKYQHALQAIEADRYRGQWPVTLTTDVEPPGNNDAWEAEYPVECYWDMPMDERCFFTEEFAAEITEEVITFDPEGPCYKGRRVVRLPRIDMRQENLLMIRPYFDFQISGAGYSPTQSSETSD